MSVSGRNERIAALEDQIIRFGAQLAPPGWQRIDLHCVATVAVNDIALTVLQENGKAATAESVPSELTDLLGELRRAHYVPERGTWFSVLFMIEPGSEPQRLYNFDYDPEWNPPIPQDAWRRDQIVLPRDAAYTPDWLRARLEGREPDHGLAQNVQPLNPIEQMELLSNEISLVLADHAPPLWRMISGHYQAVGENVQFPPLLVHKADGTMAFPAPPASAGVLFDRLRAGMYNRGRAWSRIDFQVVFENSQVSCQAKYTWDEEPAFNPEPTAEDVRRELERFPRTDVPEWMTRRLNETQQPDAPQGAPQGLREARLFDDMGPNGDQPSVSRPAVPAEEVERVVEYLRKAPIVLAARSYGKDMVDPSRGENVPLTFHTDGTWVWSGGTAYYLREHGIPPEPELVAHIRAMGFQVPEVDSDTMGAASDLIMSPSPPPPTPSPASVPSSSSDSSPPPPLPASAPASGPDAYQPSSASASPPPPAAPAPAIGSDASSIPVIPPPPPPPAVPGSSAPAAPHPASALPAGHAPTPPPTAPAAPSAGFPPGGPVPMPQPPPLPPGAPAPSAGHPTPPPPVASPSTEPWPVAAPSAAPPPPAPSPSAAPPHAAGQAHAAATVFEPVPPSAGQPPAAPSAGQPPAAATVFEPAAEVVQSAQQPAPPPPAAAATVFEPLAEPVMPPPPPPPGPAPAPHVQPQVAAPNDRPASPAEVLRRLEQRLGDLAVPPSAYRLQEAAEGAWCMVYEESRWSVFALHNGERRQAADFDAAGKAAAYLLGSLLLVPPAEQHQPPPPSAAESISPLPGEPPLSLFRDRQEIELPAGTIVDRYGAPTGNVTYALRTPFAERSLPPEWANHPYHSYRLQRTCRVLTGIAVPWFDQPGGGTAYVFPRSIADLLADGTLYEG
ncbi:TNT domain-containing protein [Actinomadura rudentiformis]|uniref:TNT domain-containing protein n=1 Tax=Actinomadura rudentiformis TaxID=359158 RepID=A0A6H9YNB3_9ACTN|nr:TNT domain-containing protein [Actinomadura rudentiformis]KAB2341302.1 TNT domain-containing protein [Actinomadura rudentiformis]